MTRADFMTRLRRGLAGLPPATIDDIATDYDTHFADAIAAGRSEQEVAGALGAPGRLARELRAEAGLKKWEEQKNPSAAAAAVFAVLGLGAIDIIVLLPILMGVVAAIFGFFVACIAGLFAGAIVFAAGPFAEPPGGPATAILLGIGIMAISTCIGAIVTMVSVGLVNALVWYGRLHYRLLKPALDAQA
jgi:uncharacterized membrane protein